jgi:hypothetical protein
MGECLGNYGTLSLESKDEKIVLHSFTMEGFTPKQPAKLELHMCMTLLCERLPQCICVHRSNHSKKKKKSNNAQQLNSACFREGAKKPEFLTISSSVVSQPMTTSD